MRPLSRILKAKLVARLVTCEANSDRTMIALPDLEAGNIAGACDSTLRPRCIAVGGLSRQLSEPPQADTVPFPSFPNRPSLVSASPAGVISAVFAAASLYQYPFFSLQLLSLVIVLDCCLTSSCSLHLPALFSLSFKFISSLLQPQSRLVFSTPRHPPALLSTTRSPHIASSHLLYNLSNSHNVD